jgi:hypothetical protein
MSTRDDNVKHEEVLGLVDRLRSEDVMKAMARVSEVEPVVIAYATAAAAKIQEYAGKAGLEKGQCTTIFREMLLAQVVCVEAVRLGHHKLWQDVFSDGGMPDDDAKSSKGGQ